MQHPDHAQRPVGAATKTISVGLSGVPTTDRSGSTRRSFSARNSLTQSVSYRVIRHDKTDNTIAAEATGTITTNLPPVGTLAPACASVGGVILGRRRLHGYLDREGVLTLTHVRSPKNGIPGWIGDAARKQQALPETLRIGGADACYHRVAGRPSMQPRYGRWVKAAKATSPNGRGARGRAASGSKSWRRAERDRNPPSPVTRPAGSGCLTGSSTRWPLDPEFAATGLILKPSSGHGRMTPHSNAANWRSSSPCSTAGSASGSVPVRGADGFAFIHAGHGVRAAWGGLFPTNGFAQVLAGGDGARWWSPILRFWAAFMAGVPHSSGAKYRAYDPCIDGRLHHGALLGSWACCVFAWRDAISAVRIHRAVTRSRLSHGCHQGSWDQAV